ncbi:hypothetical protein [Bacillus sp. NPDC077027]|uniref:hypothetical protein n=1 Tax=Bacillus sp. NPDC077027 TaxID=3390548 RepID=UPI003D0065E6
MEIKVETAPHYSTSAIHVGQVHYTNIEIGRSPQMLKGRLRLFQESLFFEYEGQSLMDIPQIKEWDELIAELPLTRFLSNIQRESFIETTDSAQDLSTFFSLKYFLPILTLDADKLTEPITLSRTEARHILWTDTNNVKGTLADPASAHVSKQTKNALQLVFFPPSISREKTDTLLQSLTKMFTQIHGGESKYHIFEKAL